MRKLNERVRGFFMGIYSVAKSSGTASCLFRKMHSKKNELNLNKIYAFDVFTTVLFLLDFFWMNLKTFEAQTSNMNMLKIYVSINLLKFT